ncbi:MAG: glycosyltransferase [Bacteroidetes bacterium]|nr:glycosyltransferase [Bacteroidota bacterium]
MKHKNSCVSHVIVNNMGGITSLIQHLILYKGEYALEQNLVQLDIIGNLNTPAKLEDGLNCVRKKQMIDSNNNWYYTFGNLAKLLSEDDGILVSNDQYDLIMLQAFNIPKKVVQIVHDLYNVDLAKKYHDCVDVFIAHSMYISEQLKEILPHRTADIYFIHYGIPLHPTSILTIKETKPLKLLFLGRHTATKGIFDLIKINRLLVEKNIYVQWVILGNGPDTVQLKNEWNGIHNVSFKHPPSITEVMNEIKECDILVMPTKFEGLPVAMLEAMSMGCVPVVSNLEGGIQELVEDDINGYKCTMDDNALFAEKISYLHLNRKSLLQLQQNAQEKIYTYYNASIQMPKYQYVFFNLFKNKRLPRHHSVSKKIGSRLDQFWIPNCITHTLRKSINGK